MVKQKIVLICTTFKEICQNNGVSAYKLSTASGISAPAIYRFWNGKSVPTLETLYRLLDALNALTGKCYSICNLEY